MRVGFPHSEIPGSKLVCQLPGAYRRLRRPSSPVIAKASTTCTCSLDPITLSPRTLDSKPRATGELVFAASEVLLCPSNATIQSLPIPVRLHSTSNRAPAVRVRTETFTSSVLLKSNYSRSTLGVECSALTTNVNAQRLTLEWGGGGERDRTDDLLLAKQALSQLSYTPDRKLVGLDGFEPSTPALSRRCSNQLSYRPLRTWDPGLRARDSAHSIPNHESSILLC